MYFSCKTAARATLAQSAGQEPDSKTAVKNLWAGPQSRTSQQDHSQEPGLRTQTYFLMQTTKAEPCKLIMLITFILTWNSWSCYKFAKEVILCYWKFLYVFKVKHLKIHFCHKYHMNKDRIFCASLDYCVSGSKFCNNHMSNIINLIFICILYLLYFILF